MKQIFFILTILTWTLSLCAQDKPDNTPPVTSSVKAGNLVFISGKLGINPTTLKLSNITFEAEVAQTMENLKQELKIHGLELDDLVSVIIYLKDIKRYDVVNSIYKRYFNKKYPTRTCIAVADLPANASVEISGIAHIKNSNEPK